MITAWKQAKKRLPGAYVRFTMSGVCIMSKDGQQLSGWYDTPREAWIAADTPDCPCEACATSRRLAVYA